MTPILARILKCVFLMMVLVIAGCSSSGTPTPTPIIPTPTPPPTPTPVTLDVSVISDIEGVDRWSSACTQNTSGKPISQMGGIQPFKAVVLAYNPKNKAWEASEAFPTLIDTSGDPGYLICVFKYWTPVTTYSSSPIAPSDGNGVPGYREDWKVTVQDLTTKEIYTTEILLGAEPPETVSYVESYTPITEVVGNAPREAANAALFPKQKIDFFTAKIPVPYGFGSVDFAPDGQSLYIPTEDGYVEWNFTTKTQHLLAFTPMPASCSHGYIRTSFDGQYLVTLCGSGDSTPTLEVWSTADLNQISKLTVFSFLSPQFVHEAGKVVVSVSDNKISSLDLNSGEVTTVTPLFPWGQEEEVIWTTPDAARLLTYSSYSREYHIWDPAAKKALASTNLSVDRLSQDGRWVFDKSAQGDVTIVMRDALTMQTILEVTADGYSEFQVSPTGRLLAVLDTHKVTLVDLQEKTLLGVVPLENPGTAILFSPDDKTVAVPMGTFYSGEYDNTSIDVMVFSTGLP